MIDCNDLIKNSIYIYVSRLLGQILKWREFLLLKACKLEESARILQWIIMASLTFVCFVPAKGLVRDLSANSSNIAFEVPLASKWWWQSGLISHKHSQLRNMPFTNLKKVQEFYNGSLWLALHTYVSSLPRDSSETFRLTRQTSTTIT